MLGQRSINTWLKMSIVLPRICVQDDFMSEGKTSIEYMNWIERLQMSESKNNIRRCIGGMHLPCSEYEINRRDDMPLKQCEHQS